MKHIDTEKLSKEMHDTLVHRASVMRSGQYLASYLMRRDRSVDAIRLLGRCSVHDISKIQNTEEFMSLASIIDDIENLRNVHYVQTPEQIEAKTLHWKNNSHHPEYYDSPNDMSDLDLMEMACDCHARSKQYGTDLISYIKAQQEIRFHFDSEHLKKLLEYCSILVKLAEKDDYRCIVNDNIELKFHLLDTTMQKLEQFDDSCYVDRIKADRLYLKRVRTPDFASVGYSICLRDDDNTEIGYIVVKFNGYIDFKVYESYLGNGYTVEALGAFINTSSFDEVFISVRHDNECAIRDLQSLGFKAAEYSENSAVYRYRKPCKRLEKLAPTDESKQ